jgi:mannose-1-phosphate guanylyltransferase
MKAMVLCAGLGTRLRPLTEAWPKPALPFLGQPLLRYNLALLKQAQVTSVGINTHHLPEVMVKTARAECERLGLTLEVVHEPVIQGTAGGVRGLRKLLGDEPFFVLNGDILFALDLRKAAEAHQSSGALATLVLLPMPEGAKYNAVEMNDRGEVRKLAGHGPGGSRLSPWHFTGVHVLSPRIFDFMSPDGEEDSIRHVYPRALAAGEVIRGHVAAGYWSDLGTPSRYLATVRDLLHGQVPLAAFSGASPFEGADRETFGCWNRQGTVEPGAGIAGPAFIDEGARIESGARLGEAVYVGPGAMVKSGARLNRVVVMPGTEIAASEELVEVIAWKSHRIPAPLTEP